MPDLLSVDAALTLILEQLSVMSYEGVSIYSLLGRVLAEDVLAPLDLPPFPNSSVDGYAIQHRDLTTTPLTLSVVMDIPAGAVPATTLQAGQAARIMTGAVVPDGADTVIMVEDTDSVWDSGNDAPLPAQVTIHNPAPLGANIRHVGENVHRGQRVLKARRVVLPQDIGLLAGMGISAVNAYRKPRVAVLTSGDELVPIGEPLPFGKIYDSNSLAIAALIDLNGGQAILIPPAKDTLESAREMFQTALSHQPDCIISTAGVSVGTLDMVRRVLDELGEIGFWRVNVRPGKPFAFGQVSGVPFFGLPGNPVSALVTFDIFVRPALRYMASLPEDALTASVVVGEEITSDGRRTYARVQLRRENDQWIATLTGTQSSGALLSMVMADALLIIPEDMTRVAAGTRLQARLLRPLESAV
ncbi:MAG: gephyrin-like molybdotransferase Glp [Phototrophicaceae bacterium]|jgi:molybdopterin molybdotransferase